MILLGFLKKRREKKALIAANAFDQNGKPDYAYYIMKKEEKILYTLAGGALFFVIGFIFYRSIVFSGVMALLGYFAPDIMYKRIIAKRSINLGYQFKDMLYAVSSSLSSGKSIEQAFASSAKDLELIYPDPDTDILREIKYVVRGLSMSETIEDLIQDFAKRAYNEDIQNFADVLESSKRAGGNLIDVVRTTSNIISDKIEIKREIAVSLSEKKFEQKAMIGLMLGMILGLSYMSGDYMDPMFQSVIGRLVMTIAFLLFIVSYFVGDKIVNIEV